MCDSFEACYEDVWHRIGSFSPSIEIIFYSSIQYSWSSSATKGTNLITTAVTFS